MRSIDPGVLDISSCFSFTPSEIAKKYYFYPIWIGHYFCNTQYFIKRDYFPYLLLVYVRSGEFTVEYRGRKYLAHKGDVVLIDCREPHYYYASDRLEFLYLHFDGSNSHELCQYIMSQFNCLFQGKDNIMIGNLLYQMIDSYERGEMITVSESSLKIYEMLSILTAYHKKDQSPSGPVELAINYIRNHLEEPITLELLADLSHLSAYYFSHLFKAHTGYSPLEYVISLRMNTAKVLLKSTNLSVSEIAYRVGYGNYGSFINMFTRKAGCSPTVFRQSHI